MNFNYKQSLLSTGFHVLIDRMLSAKQKWASSGDEV